MKDARVKFPWKVFSRVVVLQAYLVVAAFGISALTARYFFKKHYVSQMESQLQAALTLVGRDLPYGRETIEWCDFFAKGTPYRIKLVTFSGMQLCDSAPGASGDIQWMEAQASFPERKWTVQILIDQAGLQSSLRIFDTWMLVVLILVAGGLGMLMAFSSRKLVVPLGELILKAKRSEGDESDASDPASDESGEWMELESALNRIQSDLRQKTDQLSREREELATLMSALSDAILAVDANGKPLFFNSRFALLFFDKESKDRQPHLGEIFRSPEVLQTFRGALDQGVTQEASIQLYVKSDPVPRYFTLSVAPLRREVGPVYGAVAIFHDVTELKKAEKIRIEFVANVSHELRTPLTAIKGYTDTLREDVTARRYDSSEKFLEVISRNVDRLMRLIVDLLDLSSLESQDAADKISKSAVDTKELTARVLAQLEARRKEKSHQIETVFNAKSVDADPARVEQVLVNLLENAVKYVPTGGKITVTWETSKKFVRLRVSDNGPGIPPEHHSRLFERFYRVDQARSRELGGTGLGLAIVKHIMQRHGGTVWISSESSKGTEFICQFPMS